MLADILLMARHLQLEIVAEGVETKEQVEFLQHQSCDYVQGFYYYQPLPEADFFKLLDES